MPLWPSELVTTTSTAPAAWAAVVAVSEVLLTTVTLVAAVPPRLTVAPAAKPVPVTVTAVPPLLVPELGEIALTVGAELVPVPLPVRFTVCGLLLASSAMVIVPVRVPVVVGVKVTLIVQFAPAAKVAPQVLLWA